MRLTEIIEELTIRLDTVRRGRNEARVALLDLIKECEKNDLVVHCLHQKKAYIDALRILRGEKKNEDRNP
jgi:hypothetical protein